MKIKNKKYVSLFTVFVMFAAYTLPFCSPSFAEKVYTAELMAVNDSLDLTTISDNYKFIAQTALSDKNITENMTSAEKLNDYVYGRCKYITNKGNSVIGEAECLNIFGVKNKDYYMAFNVLAGATVTVYGKNSGSAKRYLTAATAVNKRDIAVSDVFEGNQAGVFTFQVQNDETVYIASYQVAAGAEEPSDNDGGGDMTIAGFTVEFDTASPTDSPTEAPTNAPTGIPTDVPGVTPTNAPTDKPTDVPVATPKVTLAPEVTPTPKVTAVPDVTSIPAVTSEPSQMTEDEKAVRNDAKNLTLKAASQTAVYFDIDLNKTGTNGSSITWESSNSKYIDIQEISHIKRNYTGVVTRPREDECTDDGGVPVTLTATLKKGNAEYKKKFEVSVRKWNPVYYNDFQEDAVTQPDGDYKAISDNVEAVNGEIFRGIRVDTLKESRCFDSFLHGNNDTPKHFDKRIMATDSKYGRPKALTSETDEEKADGRYNENFAFYYNEYQKHEVNSTPLWIQLIDPATKQAPKGVIMMSMDIYVIDGNQKFNMGLGTSKASQMCRFMLGNKPTSNFKGYNAAGYVRLFDNESSIDFMGGDSSYRHPVGDWVKAVIVANSNTHKWDFYYDGMQMATGLNFRNAQDMFPTIEFMMDRNTTGGKYLIDNIYVENMTEDYRDTYWEALEIPTLSKDETTGYYIAEHPFTLQYQGTDGLTGNMFIWKSSDTDVLKIETKRIPVDELINCGYTAEQVAAYKAQGITNPIVVLAEPQNIDKDTFVTITAKMQIDDVLKTKDFKVLIKKKGSGTTGDAEKARADADAITCVRNGDSIVSNITMDTTGRINGSKITWKSSNERVLSANGIVSRPSSNAVTVTLTASVQYGNAVEYRTFNVSVQPKSSGSSGGGGGGGGSSVKPNNSYAISIPGNINAVLPTRQPEQNKEAYPSETEVFTDIYKAEWARTAIEYLFSKDVINGYGDGTFGVNDNVTREQFVRMLLTALNVKLTSDKDSVFKDVSDGEWYSNYVNTALQLGIVSGISDDIFGVGEEILRQDMAVMCMKAIELAAESDKTPEPTESPKETLKPLIESTTESETDVNTEVKSEDISEFTDNSTDKLEVIPKIVFGDESSIADYAKRAVALMTQEGYVSGDENGNFAPRKSLTRAEAAAVLYRIMTEGI